MGKELPNPSQLSLQFESDRDRAENLLRRLQAHGLTRVTQCRLTRNRSTMVSLVGTRLRIHEVYVKAPDQVLKAIATFFTSRNQEARSAARRELISWAGPRPPAVRRKRRAPEADAALVKRLSELHRELNERHFGGLLTPLSPQVSARMKSRLGHYAPAAPSRGEKAEIVISRRHIRRDGIGRATDTLLHEMVHQWQDENGLPLNHGREFRKKALEVGTAPFARRPRDISLSG